MLTRGQTARVAVLAGAYQRALAGQTRRKTVIIAGDGATGGYITPDNVGIGGNPIVLAAYSTSEICKVMRFDEYGDAVTGEIWLYGFVGGSIAIITEIIEVNP